MSGQDGKVFQMSWLAKFLFFIFGAMLFLGSAYALYGLFFLPLDIKFDASTGFAALMVFVAMISGFLILLHTTAKVTITSQDVVRSNWIKTKIIPLSSILVIKRVYRSNGKGGAYFLFIKTKQSVFYMCGGFSKKKIDEAVAYILEKIGIYYPESLAAMEEEKSKEQREAVENFWRK